ncbi:hypothetical protein TNCV_1988591 [Trichonephila clavipes]|nr:hypothetical protein TNCV_1988591 [Trichonephila clavipes]
MDKCVQMLDDNSGAIRFQTDRECICVFRMNRTLMRPRDEGRLWWPANEKGRGACCGPTPDVQKGFSLETRGNPGKRLERKYLKRGEEI